MNMDLSKSYDVFQPEKLKGRINIIGCGSVGSTTVELLARYGLTKFNLYDFDVVEPKNIANQMFRASHIGMKKTDALKQIICEINPDAEKDIKTFEEGYTNQRLSGFVFLAVDSIELRKQIAEDNKNNMQIKAMFDVRTRLFDAQHYAADWANRNQVDQFIGTMNFTHDEAAEETPMSACRVVLGVAPTVRLISNYAVANFINYVTGAHKLKQMILAEAFNFDVDGVTIAV